MTVQELKDYLEDSLNEYAEVEIQIANSSRRIPIERVDLNYRDFVIIVPDEPLFREIEP